MYYIPIDNSYYTTVNNFIKASKKKKITETIKDFTKM